MRMNNGLFLPNRNSSSTAGYEFHSFSTEVKTARNENSTASDLPLEQYHYLISKFDELDKRVQILEKSSQKVDCFAKQSILLQRICIIVIFILPLIVSAAAACVVWIFSVDETLVTCAKWYLGILGFSGIVDLFAIFSTEKFWSAKIEDLERRMCNLEKS